MKAKGKRPPKGQPLRTRGAEPKRRKRDEDAVLDTEPEDMFLHSDEEKNEREADSDEDSVEETAEEKKLRLAKEYLHRLRETEQAEASGSDDETTHDAVAQRLRSDAMETMGQVQRRIADRLILQDLVAAGSEPSSRPRTIRCHRLPVTGVALTADDAAAFSVSKDGSIFRTDVERGVSTRFQDASQSTAQVQVASNGPEWVAKAAQRGGGANSLLTVAVSSDGKYLAVGGGDKKVHVWDARSHTHIQAFAHHRDIVTGLAFRDGTHELYSGSFDRTVKIWSLDDRAYVDTLYGHQSEVLAVDALRAERVLTSGQDHTCRVWKIPEDSHLIFRGYGQAIDCCRYVTGTEWVSGSSDGSLALWSQLKKKPGHIMRDAHAVSAASGGAGSVGGDCASWVSAVACCRGADLVVGPQDQASGAGDGIIRLWAVDGDRPGPGRKLRELGGLPARGFVNALQIARSGRFLIAGMGQEPRLGRWTRDSKAKNGLLIHSLQLRDE